MQNIIILSLIIAIAIELMFHHSSRARSMRWLVGYREGVVHLFRNSSLWNGPVGVLSVLGLPVFILWAIQYSTSAHGFLLSLVAVLVGVLVLFYCFRFSPMDKVIDALNIQATPEEQEIIEQQAVKEVLGHEQSELGPRYQQLTEQVTVQANERLFAVIFWFFVLGGPVGALLYRMTWYLSSHPMDQQGRDVLGFNAAARRLLGILNWVPARLTVIGYALAGGFEDTMHQWRAAHAAMPPTDIETGNQLLLKCAGIGAMHVDRYETLTEDEGELESQKTVSLEAVRAARALVLRALLVCGTMIALVTVAGVFR